MPHVVFSPRISHVTRISLPPANPLSAAVATAAAGGSSSSSRGGGGGGIVGSTIVLTHPNDKAKEAAKAELISPR